VTCAERGTLVRRAKSALWGVAVGDAFGKMTEGYWPPEVVLRYGGRLRGFRPPVPASPDRDGVWGLAEVTDDTRFTVLVAESIVTCGSANEEDLTHRIVAQPIKGWPGWEEFCQAVRSGQRQRRTGNGAPTRVAPVAILAPSDQIQRLADAVYRCCRASHDSRSAIAAACAIAAAFSAVIDGKDTEAVLQCALTAARIGEQRGAEEYLPSLPRRVEWLLRACPKSGIGPEERPNPGFAAWEGAISALYLFYTNDSADDAIIEAANQGGDADSIASMAGGLLAAHRPDSLPAEWRTAVQEHNDLPLDRLSDALVDLRFKAMANR